MCRGNSESTGFQRKFSTKSEKVWSKAKSGKRAPGSGEIPEKVWEALVQSHVKFNRTAENVPDKVWDGLGSLVAWCKAMSNSTEIQQGG